MGIAHGLQHRKVCNRSKGRNYFSRATWGMFLAFISLMTSLYIKWILEALLNSCRCPAWGREAVALLFFRGVVFRKLAGLGPWVLPRTVI